MVNTLGPPQCSPASNPGMWLPGQTGGVSLDTPVSSNIKTTETPLSGQTLDIFDIMLQLFITIIVK